MLRVLIVDDNIDDRNGILKYVPWETLDCEAVGTASNGAEGLRQALEKKPELVITDISMPVMNGIEMTAKIREKLPDTHFIYISCFDDFEFMKKAVEYHVSSYILKPISIDELVGKIIDVRSLSEENAKKKLIEYKTHKWIDANRNILAEKFFLQFLGGHLNEPQDIDMQLSCLGISDNEEYKIILLKNRNHDYFYSTAYYIKETVESQNTFDGYVVIYDSSLVAVILHGESCIDCDRIVDFFGEIIENMKSELSESTICLIGDETGDFYKLPEKFRTMLDTLSKEYFPYGVSVVMQSDVEDSAFSLRVDINDMQSDVEAVIDKSIDADTFIERYYNDKYCSSEVNIKSISFYILTTVVQKLNERNKSLGDLFDDEFIIWKKLVYFKTIVDIRQLMKNILTAVCRLINEDEAGQNDNITVKIKKYIDEHYADIISLEEITKNLYISVNYANRIFKKYTGETMFSYLLKKRMEKAKQLLLDPKLHSYEIGTMVGYASPAYFTTVFKNYTGLTPKGYRSRYYEK